MKGLAIDFAAKKEAVEELVVSGCPQGHDFINYSCPVRNVRKLTIKNLNHYIDGLSEEQIDNIFNYHEGCNAPIS